MYASPFFISVPGPLLPQELVCCPRLHYTLSYLYRWPLCYETRNASTALDRRRAHTRAQPDFPTPFSRLTLTPRPIPVLSPHLHALHSDRKYIHVRLAMHQPHDSTPIPGIYPRTPHRSFACTFTISSCPTPTTISSS
ncbi:hypothetical protein JB92DRAFT_3208948 [Gautieria morchelliformis]|nr:hypothetical protein JB92DRAFT_3208948 [Gautieria morchelliformis]